MDLLPWPSRVCRYRLLSLFDLRPFVAVSAATTDPDRRLMAAFLYLVLPDHCWSLATLIQVERWQSLLLTLSEAGRCLSDLVFLQLMHRNSRRMPPFLRF